MCPWVCRMASPLGWTRSLEPWEATGGWKEVERGTRAHCKVAPPASRRAVSPPLSSSRPAAPALSLAAAVALRLAAGSTLGRLPCGTAPSPARPSPLTPPSPPATAGGDRRRVLAWIILLGIGRRQPVAAFSAALCVPPARPPHPQKPAGMGSVSCSERSGRAWPHLLVGLRGESLRGAPHLGPGCSITPPPLLRAIALVP